MRWIGMTATPTPTQLETRTSPFKIGLYSFVEIGPDPATGETISPQDRTTHILETIELADQVGLDVFGIGEHHRPDFVASAPAVIPAAATHTRTIHLTSTITVLSSDDPMRVC